jgi:hypothetical protein
MRWDGMRWDEMRRGQSQATGEDEVEKGKAMRWVMIKGIGKGNKTHFLPKHPRGP